MEEKFSWTIFIVGKINDLIQTANLKGAFGPFHVASSRVQFLFENIAGILPEYSRRWPAWRILGLKQKKLEMEVVGIFLRVNFLFRFKFCIYA